MEIEQKKSAVDLTQLAIGLVVLGIVVSIGATILFNVAKEQITNAATYTVSNESVTPVTAGTKLAVGWVKSVDTVWNGSANININTGNYTYSVNSDNGVGTIVNTTSTYPNAWKVTYTVYNKSDPRFELPTDVQVGLAEYGNWFKILVIVGIAAVLLALIFMAFGNKSGSTSGGSISY